MRTVLPGPNGVRSRGVPLYNVAYAHMICIMLVYLIGMHNYQYITILMVTKISSSMHA